MPDHDHAGHRKRMRDRFAQNGLEGFAPHEALELLLCFAIPRQNVVAHRLLRHFGTLEAVLQAEPDELQRVPGIGDSAATLLSMVLPLARMAAQEKRGEQAVIVNYRQAKEYCKTLFDGHADEVLYVICLDAQGRVIRAAPAITGTIDEIAIYPRTVVACALRHNAHAVVLSHNHPSGVREPSEADIYTTDMLRDALMGVDINLLDHIIYAEGDCVSIAQWRQLEQIRPLYTEGEKPKAADTKRSGQKRARAMQDGAEEGETGQDSW